MNNSTTVWPKYRSHKIVAALPIVAKTPDAMYVDPQPGTGFHKFEPNEPGMAHKAVPGDYAVVYEDGYKSVSPKAVFEAGYTRVHQYEKPSSRRDQPEQGCTPTRAPQFGEHLHRDEGETSSTELVLLGAITSAEQLIVGLHKSVMGRVIVTHRGARQATIARTEFEGAFQRLRQAVAGSDSPWEG